MDSYDYQIETPENITLDFQIAGIASRFMAALIDTTLILLLYALVGYLFSLLTDRFASLGGSVATAIQGIVGFLILWGYYILFEVFWNGQSPGKRVIGLQVVREGGRPITFAAAAIRNLIRFVDFLPALYGVGVVVMFVDKRARRLGDLVAGTLVVRMSRAVTLDSLGTGAAAAPASATLSLVGIEQITRQDIDIVSDFLSKRGGFASDVRLRLALQIANALRTRLGIPLGGDSERFLEYIEQQYRLYQIGRQIERTAAAPAASDDGAPRNG